MRLARIQDGLTVSPALVDAQRGVIPTELLVAGRGKSVIDLLNLELFQQVVEEAERMPQSAYRPADSVRFVAPYTNPRLIWGIGLNYVEHAGDLAEKAPTDEPASFIKGSHTIAGPGEPIHLPRQSERVTGEAELGLIIGRTCRNVSEAEAMDYVFGVCLVLDQTAEDILRRNPRFLTRCKNFPTFFVFGPEIIPMAEVKATFPDLASIEVQTIKNGSEIRRNTVSNMTFGPEFLVSFHSQVMPLHPGDIISTGTPGAIVIEDGDIIECHIPGLGRMASPVVRTGL